MNGKKLEVNDLFLASATSESPANEQRFRGSLPPTKQPRPITV